ncbi:MULTISPECIES: EutN/CcmL family microcompartment protein [unclassified Nocardioides]|uniref:EutN/CcmL family microcompartment protein n=1 Tax=unclassified Nocardioides TaxID=2615069 RepID=UPI000057093F|nr:MULTISPECIES: EutN/CcmL family microcompartment protein [unclassified Nocardioides]ABL83533.1 Ethanolamine utilization protein EutN/carboxysome structural protein Ccml [Nocardioides sp. JS614]
MRIARVVGSAVSTVKDPSLVGHKLLLVQETDASSAVTGSVFVAIDVVGAGSGELVLVSEGSAARHSATTTGQPVDAVIMGILDSLEVDGAVTFRKS